MGDQSHSGANDLGVLPDLAVSAMGLPRIESIQTIEVKVPASVHGRITSVFGRVPEARHALVLVHAGGLTGLGEAPTDPSWHGEDAVSVANAVERYLGPALIGGTRGIRNAVHAMNHALAGNWCAKAALETALWDLLGKASGLPLHVLLGGGPALSIKSKYVIGMIAPDEVQNAIARGRLLGFDYFKLKVGGTLDQDLARVKVAAEALEPGERIGVDANGGWSHATALAALESLQKLNVSFIEQPVSPQSRKAMANITARSLIPVVAHESVFRVQDSLEAAISELGHVWALTPTINGGVLSTIDQLTIARLHSIPCLLSGGSDLGIATALLLQIGAAFDEIASCPVPSDIVGPIWNEGDVVQKCFRFDGGYIMAPPGTGLGVVLDPDRIAAYRVS